MMDLLSTVPAAPFGIILKNFSQEIREEEGRNHIPNGVHYLTIPTQLDLEQSEAYDEKTAHSELQELNAELTEEIRRASSTMIVNGVERVRMALIPYLTP